MKIIYTILFFSGVFLLVVLSFLFLKFINEGGSSLAIISMLGGIVCCILLLVYFLSIYLKIPSGKRNH